MSNEERFYLMPSSIDDAENRAIGNTLEGWWGVVDDDAGIIAYFGNEEHAAAFVDYLRKGGASEEHEVRP